MATGERRQLTPEKGPWHMLGYVLRMLRTAHGESLQDVAEGMPIAKSALWAWETAEKHPREAHCRTLDERWKTGGLLLMLHGHATNPDHDLGWFGPYVLFESEATMIRNWEVAWIPGLLQTREYAQDGLVAGRSKAVEQALAARLERQAILTKDSPPHLSVLLDETALLRLSGDTGRGQLARLLEASDMPNVQIRAVPLAAGTHIGLNGGFQIITTSRHEVAYDETASAGRLVTSPAEVRELAVSFDLIGGVALTREATRDKIHEIARSL